MRTGAERLRAAERLKHFELRTAERLRAGGKAEGVRIRKSVRIAT